VHRRRGKNEIEEMPIRLWSDNYKLLPEFCLSRFFSVYLSSHKDRHTVARPMNVGREELVRNSSTQTGRRRLSRTKWAAGTRVLLSFLLNSAERCLLCSTEADSRDHDGPVLWNGRITIPPRWRIILRNILTINIIVIILIRFYQEYNFLI